MVEHQISNVYDIKRCAVSVLLDSFEKEDQLFAAQCVWWLASILQFTEILISYRHYPVFPSEYNNHLVVSPLPNPGMGGSHIPEPELPELDVHDSYTEVQSGRSKSLPIYQSKKQRQWHPTRSRKIFKNMPNYSISELEARFGKQNKKRQSIIWNHLKIGE